jgi:hypothetical protein
MSRAVLLLFLLSSAFAQTAKFPGAIAADKDLTVQKDKAQSTLTGALTSSATSATVVTGSKFIAGQIVSIDNEQMLVCSVVSNTVNFGYSSCPNVDGRGYAGTSAASHSNGALISGNIVAWNHNSMAEEVKALETFIGVAGANIVTGFNGRTGAITPQANDYTWTQIAGAKQGNTNVPQMAGANSGVTGALHCNDGSGNATTSGCLLPVGGALDVTDYVFAAQTCNASNVCSVGGSSGAALVNGVSATLTLTPLPAGVASGGSLYLSGGTGTAEAVTITGLSGSDVTFTPAQGHTGAWTVQSATAGWREAAQAAGANGAVYFPPGTYTLRGSFTVPFDGQTYFADDAGAVTITTANAANLHRFAITGSKSDLTFLRLGWDGNFANQTYSASTLNTAIDASNSVRVRVINNRFHAFGYSSSADASFAQVISLYSATDCHVLNNLFLSNFAFEVNVNGTSGCVIAENTLGSPSLSESRSNVNWWDTYSAGFGTFVAQSSKVFFTGNRMFGPQRSSTLSAFGDLINVNGSNSSVQSFDIHIENNTFEGLGNGRGTVSVTNGSGVIAGSSTTFASIDVGRTFQVEGDATVYQVSGYTSATQITVTPVIARANASGLRYLYVNSGDVIQVYNVDQFTIIGNSINNSGDNGIDVAASPAGFFTQHGVVANNAVRRSQVDAFYLGGAVFNVLYSGNLGYNCGLKQTAAHQACFELSPTDQSVQAGQNMWHLTFAGNQCIDDQAATTMLYAFQMEAGQSAKIFSNTLTGNTYFSYAGSGALFDSGTTATMQGTMFNTQSFSSSMQLTPVAFANLGSFIPTAGNGSLVYCLDCAATSLYDNTCAAGGSGSIATLTNSVWSCQQKQASLKGSDIASAATIAIPASGDAFIVTGTTNITTVNTCNAAAAGRRVSLIFSGILTFTDGSNLKLGGNFVTTADDAITIACNGTDWVELARAVN